MNQGNSLINAVSFEEGTYCLFNDRASFKTRERVRKFGHACPQNESIYQRNR